MPHTFQIPDFLDVYAASDYEGPMRQALLRIKKDNEYSLAYAVAKRMADTLPKHLRNTYPVLAVPVPASPKRLRERGFSLPHLLAEALSHYFTNIQYAPRLLRRIGDRAEQKGLSRYERFDNVKGAFQAESAAGCNVLIVDDIVTTGATLTQAASVLYEAGALKADACCAAMALRE
ncbi:MAG: hypothetical protein K6G50_10240 [bacterium]|nr:hypothetical protein [bacterium]